MKLSSKVMSTCSFIVLLCLMISSIDTVNAAKRPTSRKVRRNQKKKNNNSQTWKLPGTANVIYCDDIPVTIEEDFDLDHNIICNEEHFPDNIFFEVKNNPVTDCKGHVIGGNKIAKKQSTAFRIHGGATIKNCLLHRHHVAIERTKAGEGESLVVEDTTITFATTGTWHRL